MVVAVGIPAAPLVSLVYMVLVVFKGIEIATDEVVLSTFTMSQRLRPGHVDGQRRLRRSTQTCFGEKFGFVFDQFSKGSLGDVFDIYSLGLSDISIDAVDGLTKLYVMNFRMLSAAYLVAVALMLYGYFSQVRQRRRSAPRPGARSASRRSRRPGKLKARPASADAPQAAAAATSPEPADEGETPEFTQISGLPRCRSGIRKLNSLNRGPAAPVGARWAGSPASAAGRASG